MELVTKCALVTIAVVLASIFRSKIKSHTYSTKKLAPKAGGGWPIIGHLPLLGASRLPHKVLATMAEKHGPIFRINLGVKEALVLSSCETAKECLLKNDKAILGRPNLVSSELMCYNYAMFGFGPYGAYWRYMRKIVTMELLSNHRVISLSYVWESEVKTFVRKVYELWTTKKNDSNMVLVDLKQLFGDLFMNIIVRIISGKQFVEDSDEALRFKEAIREFFRLLGSFAVGDALPFLRWMDLGGQEKAMKRSFTYLDQIVEGWLLEHKQRRSKDLNRKVDQDFMDVLLSVIDEDATKYCNYDADTINKATCLMMIAGGSDTSAATLTWAVSLLLNNLHTLKTANEELDKQVGKERQVSESDMSRLEYLQAIVKETLRLQPPVPLMGFREFIDDCTIDGHDVSQGTRLLVNFYYIFRDSRVWVDPLEFRPDRFLGNHKDVDVKGHHFQLIPFGAGRRICPGISFALQAMHFSLASFLHAFELSTPSNAPVDMNESFGLTTVKTKPLEVLVFPRLSSEAYTY